MSREASPRGFAQGVHFAFYAVLITEGITGAVASYFWWPISTAHVILFKVLLALVAIHVAAALWHEFVRKDAVIRRMGFKAINGDRRAIGEGEGAEREPALAARARDDTGVDVSSPVLHPEIEREAVRVSDGGQVSRAPLA